ncbi:hypothetical protein [Saccharibacillus brassicae]|uniref:Uncharacterized protein n=1 Tax=Saccharibacillus brassicae TaxID=2583377 RepID=A0A4Y6V136_SACBS|nr:hypothetical protein [Saccharibacillus brassicae]QDH23084.1 hypothetical protein FFV09_20835 [Saccharibacillus brassicae]
MKNRPTRLKPRPVEHEERLIVQTLTFRWGKEARGAPFSTARNEYGKAFRIPDPLLHCDTAQGLLYQEILIRQDAKGFEKIHDRSSILKPSEGVYSVQGIEIQKTDSEYLCSFRYSEECGKPIRQDRRYNLLVEKAFELKAGEYGRMIYNGRHTSTYTGEWYYELHMINVLPTADPNPNVFIDTEPVKEYKQIAILF